MAGPSRPARVRHQSLPRALGHRCSAIVGVVCAALRVASNPRRGDAARYLQPFSDRPSSSQRSCARSRRASRATGCRRRTSSSSPSCRRCARPTLRNAARGRVSPSLRASARPCSSAVSPRLFVVPAVALLAAIVYVDTDANYGPLHVPGRYPALEVLARQPYGPRSTTARHLAIPRRGRSARASSRASSRNPW